MSPAVIDPESSPATAEPRMPGPGHPLTDLAGEFDRELAASALTGSALPR